MVRISIIALFLFAIVGCGGSADDGQTPSPTVSLSASPSTVTEGSSVTVTAMLSSALTNNVSIPIVLTAGTAEANDYGMLSSITISSGQTTGTGTITTAQDTDTDDETFTVALSSPLPSGVTAGSGNSVRITITDDDTPVTPTVSLSVTPSTVTEGSSVTVRVTLSSALTNNISIPIVLTAGTAEADDYGMLSSITISSGQTTGTGTVSTSQDTDTDDETFTVALGTLPSSVTAGSPSSVTVTIDDDTPSVTWQEGVFAPSDDFHQVCADPSKAYDQANAVAGTYVDENNWLRSWSHEHYLWYDEIEDRDPACCNTPEYFELMKTFETTASGKPKDRFHYSIPTEEFIKDSQAIEVGYGAKFEILSRRPPRDVRVAYVEPNSPASIAGLSRGAQVLEIDGVDMINSADPEDVNTLNAGLFPSEAGERHTFTVQDRGSFLSRPVFLTAREIIKDLVRNVTYFSNLVTGERVGHMMFNSHDRPAGLELIRAVQSLKAAGIDDLIIDLRYNPGGRLVLAQMLSSMIAGPSKTEQVFVETRTNDKHESSFLMFDLNSAGYGYGVDGRNVTLPSLDLPRLFVLTGPGTCSASEAIINGLRGVDVEVILIGSTTCGKPYAFLPTENCGMWYHSINFQSANAKGFGDYADGFPPDCRAADDFSNELGDKEERLLKTALLYALEERCPPSATAAGESQQSAAAKAKIVPEQPVDTGPAITIPTRPPGMIINPPDFSDSEELIEIPPFREESLQE